MIRLLFVFVVRGADPELGLDNGEESAGTRPGRLLSRATRRTGNAATGGL